MNNAIQDNLYTMTEIAEKLKVSRRFVEDAVRIGRIRHHRLGTQVIRISDKQLQQFLKGSIA